tara:strand:+ start:785 stop:1138 length:354 start_codon:yes stop_codon:yes gene_type:complete
MQIAETALGVLRDSQNSNEENSFMNAYSSMLVEVGAMRDELNSAAGKISAEIFHKKEKRIEDLESCLISFNQSFFSLMYYKQEMFVWKEKHLQKELEFVNFVTKKLENEPSRRFSNK